MTLKQIDAVQALVGLALLAGGLYLIHSFGAALVAVGAVLLGTAIPGIIKGERQDDARSHQDRER